MTTAEPSDVKSIIETSLEDSAIQAYLDRAQEDNELVNDVGDMDETQLRRIEELLASIKILGQVDRDRSHMNQSVGNANKGFERGKIAELKAELGKWDPSKSLTGSVIRDTDRNINTTGE